MNLFFKKTEVPVSNEVKIIDTVQLWQVTWMSRKGRWDTDGEKETEVFISEKEAYDFAEALRSAFKLIRTTYGTEVTVTKRV